MFQNKIPGRSSPSRHSPSHRQTAVNTVTSIYFSLLPALHISLSFVVLKLHDYVVP